MSDYNKKINVAERLNHLITIPDEWNKFCESDGKDKAAEQIAFDKAKDRYISMMQVAIDTAKELTLQEFKQIALKYF